VIATPTRPTFTPAEVTAYLDRIGFAGPAAPTLATLRAIHRAHLFAVPFENLDIVPLGRPLRLDPASLYDKIVRRRRGGYCYELNGLLATVLRDLGYGVTIVSVQFVETDGSLSPPFDHMALVVETADTPDRWLVDVAGGRKSTAAPLRLIDGFAEFQEEAGRAFRLSSEGDRWRLDEQSPGEDWIADYTFQLIPREPADFLPRSRYHEEHPDSYFRQGPLCSLPIPGGRLTLSKTTLITTLDGQRQEHEAPPDDLADILRAHFGLDLVPLTPDA
jgi:N-hydroxyarylamine O-acetyltransferase